MMSDFIFYIMEKTNRYKLIDTLRGLSVISMILFHACWIMSYFGILIPTETMFGFWFTVWERSICFGFILIAGYSFSLGRRHLRSGLIIFAWGLVVMAVTCFFLPEIRIIFGILTFIGSACLITILVDKAVGNTVAKSRKAAIVGFSLSVLLFVLTYSINRGYIGISPYRVALPKGLYKGMAATYIGFTEPGFFSTDYFSILPWYFLYLCGYMLYRIVKGTEAETLVVDHGIKSFEFLGRHSLPIYIIHPVVIYAFIAFLSTCVL